MTNAKQVVVVVVATLAALYATTKVVTTAETGSGDFSRKVVTMD